MAEPQGWRGARGAFVSDLTARLRHLADPEGVLAEANRALGEHLGALRVGYGEIDARGEQLTLKDDWTNGVPSNAGTFPLAEFGPAIVAENRAGLTFVSRDILSDARIGPDHLAAFTRWGIGALVAVPLIKHDRFSAILSIQSAHPRDWTADELRTIEDVAERTWEALERARTEQALRKSEERLRIAVESAELGTWDYDLQTMEGWWSPRTCAIYGVPYRELVPADQRFGLVHPEDAQRYRREVDEAALAGQPFAIEYRIVRPDGAIRWVVLRGTVGVDADGVPARATGIALDVTERRQVEERLRESQALLDAFMRNAPIGMYLKDPQGRYALVNPEMAKVLGVDAAQALGRTARELLGDAEADRIDEEERRALATGMAQMRDQFFPDRREHVAAQLIRFPVLLEGAPPRIGGFAIDTTERRRAEAELTRSREALHQSEKLTALGALLAGVAHELNNPLAVVVAYAAMLEEEAGAGAHAEDARKIRGAAERCAKIVQTFLAMARQKAPERSSVDANALVRGVLDMSEYGLRTAGIDVVTELAEGLPPLLADGDQLHQLVANLVVNARQALLETPGPRRLTVRTRPGAAATIEIEVADTGPGIAPDVQRRIFEPFYTTKPQGSGTGIGLSFSLAVAEAHGGTLRLVESGPGGTRFRLTLPAHAGSVALPEAEPDALAPAAARTALVVDDEPDLAAALARILAGEGYAVETAASGREALARLETCAFDLILSDLRMPDLDGPALFERLRAGRPALLSRLAFVTGDTLGAEAVRFLTRAGRPFVEKPFTRASVRRLLGELGRDAAA